MIEPCSPEHFDEDGRVRVPQAHGGVLTPFFKGRHDPHRRNGAPSWGRAFLHNVNVLSETLADETRAKYDTHKLRAIAADPKASHPRAAAAICVLATRELGDDKLGRLKGLTAISELLDRILGRPAASLTVTHERPPRARADVLADMVRVLESQGYRLVKVADAAVPAVSVTELDVDGAVLADCALGHKSRSGP